MPIMNADQKKIGLFLCIIVVCANIMGSGIAMLPAELAKVGSITWVSWLIAIVGALCLGYVFSLLSAKDPQVGGIIAYSGKMSHLAGFQSGFLYYHANWIGNLAIGISGLSYLSYVFPSLANIHLLGALVIVAVWLFTFINIRGARWVASFASFGIVLLLISVVSTAVLGWLFFHKTVFVHNLNVTHHSNFSAVISGVILCFWSFVGIESASVNAGLVKNPQKTIPSATIIAVSLVSLLYLSSCVALSGMFSAQQLAASNATFSMSSSKIFGPWAGDVVSLFTGISELCAMGVWMMLVSQAALRAARDKTLPAMMGKQDKNGIPRTGLIVNACLMAGLMLILMLFNHAGNVQSIFKTIISVAAIMTIVPYFYSNLYAFHLRRQKRLGNMRLLLASLIAMAFCILVMLSSNAEIVTIAFVITLVSLLFFKKHQQ